MLRLLVWASFVLLINQCTCRSFEGYTVLRVVPQNDRELQYLKFLSNNEFEDAPIEFWRVSCCLNESFDLMLNPSVEKPIRQQMHKIGLHPQVLISNVEE